LTDRDISCRFCITASGATTKEVFADSKGYVVTMTILLKSLMLLFGE
jgi:hypothetical protein